ncbi:MAG: type II toxin-antitoxin system VapC family toxin [Burkholderiales bacterium]
MAELGEHQAQAKPGRPGGPRAAPGRPGLATSRRPALRGIRVDLKRRGAQIGAADLMVAAHARTVGATVVTNNVKDFGPVKGLKVENSTQKNKKP